RRGVPHVGLTCAVPRQNFAPFGGVFASARRRRLNEVELLRFKPSGRGARAYDALRCTDAQHRLFLPTVLGLARRHRIRVRVDCSYTPMIAWHDPGADLLGKLAVYGCTGRPFRIGAQTSGGMTPLR